MRLNQFVEVLDMCAPTRLSSMRWVGDGGAHATFFHGRRTGSLLSSSSLVETN
jgi:hypothetical protein